jgi:hypothetical protein
LRTLLFRLSDIDQLYHRPLKMADAVVENPAAQLSPPRKQMSSIPNIDSLEGLGNDGSDEYSTLKKLQRHLEYVGNIDLRDHC